MTVPQASEKPQIQRIPAGAEPDTIRDIIENDGAVIVEGMISPDVIQKFNQDLDPHLQAAEMGKKIIYDYLLPTDSKYISSLAANSKTFRHDILNNSTLHNLCRATFKETGDYWMTSGFSREVDPGKPAQGFHRDEATWPLLHYQKPGAPAITISLIMALTDFTEQNGATRVILGSHRWPEVGTPSDEQAVLAVMKAGDVLAVRQGVVHAGGEHRGDQPRRIVLAYFGSCQLTPYETYVTMPREVVESMTPLAQQMIGWRSAKPALPNISGLHTTRFQLLEDALELKSNENPDKAL